MSPRVAKAGEQKSIGDVINDLWILVRDYAKQETLDPLKSIGKFLAHGVPGSLLLSLGGFFLGLGLLRLLQTETGDHLTGSWSWVPYLCTLVVLVGAVALAVFAIKRPSRARAKEQATG